MYAELHCLSNFTFLRGASHPHELVHRALALGYRALALTDECSVAGVVRAHMAAKERPLKLIVGAEFRLTCALKFAALAINLDTATIQAAHFLIEDLMASFTDTHRKTHDCVAMDFRHALDGTNRISFC